MKIPLRSFEEYVDEACLEKGLQLWEKGRVTPPVLVEAGVYESEVGTGKDRQTVRLTVDNGQLIACECTAGDANEKVCPHAAAVLFGMELGIDNAPVPAAEAVPKKRGRKKAEGEITKKPSAAKTRKQKEEKPILPPLPESNIQVSARFQDVLEQAPKELLIRFLKEESVRTKGLEEHFIAWFDRATGQVTVPALALYFTTLIDDIWKKYLKLDVKVLTQMLAPMREQLKRSRKKLDSGQLREPLAVAQAVIQVTEQIQKKSNSHIKRLELLQEDAYGMLEEISRMEITEDIQDELISFLVNEFQLAGVSSGQWRWDGLDLAASLADTEGQKFTVMTGVEQKLPTRKTADPEIISLLEKVAMKKLALLQRWRSEQEAVAFMKEKVHIRPIADALMEYYLKSGQAEKAKELAGERIAKIRNDREVAHWYDWQMRLAMNENDKQSIISNAFNYLRHIPDDGLKYYRIIMENSEPGERRKNLEKVITMLDRFYDTRSMILRIYAEEGMWAELSQKIKNYMDFRWFVENSDFILERNPSLIPKLTRELIPRLIKVFQYDFPHGAAALLQNLRKSGFELEADVLHDEIDSMLTKSKGFHLLDAFERVLRRLMK